MGECFSKGHAAFLIMGTVCTRNCRYCAVGKGVPLPICSDEPHNIAEAAARLQLDHVVITSVTRDDLDDGGARCFAQTIEAIRRKNKKVSIEVLIPDFKHSQELSLSIIMDAGPDVISHNIEVAQTYFSRLRPGGDYRLSCTLLAIVAENGFTAKSGLMIGFGESLEDIINTLTDVHETGCSIITIGQYCTPDTEAYPVKKYYTPQEFMHIRDCAIEIGFTKVHSFPLARSSYKAGELIL